jgi:hypothetical protein
MAGAFFYDLYRISGANDFAAFLAAARLLKSHDKLSPRKKHIVWEIED